MKKNFGTQHSSEVEKYIKTIIFSVITFGILYGYTSWLGIPGTLNKSTADTAVLLMGFSMILSSLSYFLNIFDRFVAYRKYLGLVGFAFAVTHLLLSLSALNSLFTSASIWQAVTSAPGTGLVAMIIFTIMALISNTKAAILLGGKWWKFILRTGYIAIFLVLIHVILLKSSRWLTWYSEGMETPPSASLLVSIFIVVVLVMRIALWLALINKRQNIKP